MKKVLVLNGPNLNMLGVREPRIYGTTTLAEINENLISLAKSADLELEFMQSNSEADLIAAIHQAFDDGINFFIVNPAAFAHTSIAMRDALCAVSIPFIEVHISNIYAREPFRQQSYFSDIAEGTISGLGAQGYSLALEFIIEQFANERSDGHS